MTMGIPQADPLGWRLEGRRTFDNAFNERSS